MNSELSRLRRSPRRSRGLQPGAGRGGDRGALRGSGEVTSCTKPPPASGSGEERLMSLLRITPILLCVLCARPVLGEDGDSKAFFDALGNSDVETVQSLLAK